VTTEAGQETLQRISDQLDEVIAMFAETHAQTAELRRMLERTCRRAEEASSSSAKASASTTPVCRRVRGGHAGSADTGRLIGGSVHSVIST
jgi:hypothetical protein